MEPVLQFLHKNCTRILEVAAWLVMNIHRRLASTRQAVCSLRCSDGWRWSANHPRAIIQRLLTYLALRQQ